jgi:hypothetical protein
MPCLVLLLHPAWHAVGHRAIAGDVSMQAIAPSATICRGFRHNLFFPSQLGGATGLGVDARPSPPRASRYPFRRVRSCCSIERWQDGRGVPGDGYNLGREVTIKVLPEALRTIQKVSHVSSVRPKHSQR